MTESFRWHPEARLFDSAGGEVFGPDRGSSSPPDGLEENRLPSQAGTILPDTAQGLAGAIGHPAFRIGAPDQPPPDPCDQPILETLTSGSTGQPRRIRRTQASWTASFAVNARFGIGPGACVATLGRLIHSLSLYGAIEGLHLGAEVHLLAGVRPDRQHVALAARRVTHLYATPAQLRLLIGPDPLPNLRLILIGGSKLDGALRESLASLAPNARIHEFYGAAETSFITLADEGTPDTSVGRPYPGVEMSLDPGGEVWVRSPYLFLGYATATRITDRPALPSPLVGEGEGGGAASGHPSGSSPQGGGEARSPNHTRWREGWLSVGEVGRHEDGFLYLKGRAGRMVTIADQNVFPEEIEALLHTLPGVTRAAVLAVPDPHRGHSLVAILQGDRSAETAILTALRTALGPLKSPKALIWRAEWPVLASGKTDIKALEAVLTWPI